MNEQLDPGLAADSQSPATSPAELMQAASASMAEIAGSIGGTMAGAMAAPLIAASHAASIAHAEQPAQAGEAREAEGQSAAA
jgi:hypothetical protein